ncbi:MAG: hypothetical protein ACRD3W_07850, partial [Terriglobales bacterium]
LEDQMNRREALRILEAKLSSIEREHNAELADDEGQRELIDNKAEAQTLAAVFDFLRDCKISHTASLLRILEGYLCRKTMRRSPSFGHEQLSHERKRA